MNTAVKLLATLRLTRLVTTDSLGERLIQQPAEQWATANSPVEENSNGDLPWRMELVSGLYCPACVGFWLGLVVLALPDNRLTRWVLRGLALNYVVLHVSSQLD